MLLSFRSIETVVMAAIGGLAGVMIAMGASYALAGLMGVPYMFYPVIRLQYRLSARFLLAVAPIVLVIGCASVRFDTQRVASYAFDQPLLTPLGQNYLPHLAYRPGQSGFHLLVSGQDAFAARAALSESSQRTLDLQYYIVAQDKTATMLLYSVLRAAERGVRVRLLIDDMNAGNRESDLAMLARHPNVEVRLFNTFARRGGFGLSRALQLLGDGDRLNRRMHNKLWIADSAVSVLGGRNLGDAYFNATQKTDFGDLDVLAAGPVVADMARSFDQFWNSAWAVPIDAIVAAPHVDTGSKFAVVEMAEGVAQFRDSDYVRSLRATALGRQVRAGTIPLVVAPASVFYDAPGMQRADTGGTEEAIFSVMRQSVESAHREVVLVTPYLVPGASGVELLCAVAGRGVRVRILTNSLVSTDVPIVHAGYARYRPQLLACGVELYEMRPGGRASAPTRIGLSSGASLHTKAVVIDGEAVFIGSMNLDPRSARLNTEVALRIDSQELGRQLVALFDEATKLDQAFLVGLDETGNVNAPLHWDAMENDLPVRYSGEPLASAGRRWIVRILGALVPEALL